MDKTSTAVETRSNGNSYDYVTLSLPKGEKDIWKAQAKKEGRSLTSFVRHAVNSLLAQQ